MFKIYQRMRAYRIYVTRTLTIRTAYAGYAVHTPNTLKVIGVAWVFLKLRTVKDSVDRREGPGVLTRQILNA